MGDPLDLSLGNSYKIPELPISFSSLSLNIIFNRAAESALADKNIRNAMFLAASSSALIRGLEYGMLRMNFSAAEAHAKCIDMQPENHIKKVRELNLKQSQSMKTSYGGLSIGIGAPILSMNLLMAALNYETNSLGSIPYAFASSIPLTRSIAGYKRWGNVVNGDWALIDRAEIVMQKENTLTFAGQLG